MTTTTDSLTIRPFQLNDLPSVLRLLSASLGAGPAGSRSAEFFHWKHLANPFGPSPMWVAELGEELVGFRAFMRWRFQSGADSLGAVRAVDTATDPSHQRMGIFSRLTGSALHALKDDADLVFNTPNEKSLPGYVKLGWSVVGRVPVYVRVSRPARFARRSLARVERPTPDPRAVEAEVASSGLQDGRLRELIEAARPPGPGLRTPWDPVGLRWRFAEAPHLDYRVVKVEVGADLRGLAVFRIRARKAFEEATVGVLLVPPGDRACVSRLVREIRRSYPVDHVSCVFPEMLGSRDRLAPGGFVRAPGGVTLVVNPLVDDIDPDPRLLDNWSLSLAELEVF